MSESITIVGLTGPSRSGKDTVAAILAAKYGFFRIALADGIRSSFRDLDGATWAITKELEAFEKTLRWGCQQMGTEGRLAAAASAQAGVMVLGEPELGNVTLRAVQGLWCHLVAAKIAYLHRLHPVRRDRFVIPDISYSHEHIAMGDIASHLGGRYTSWRLERPGSGLSGREATHSSEVVRGTLGADLTILNDGTIDDLHEKVDRFAKSFLS